MRTYSAWIKITLVFILVFLILVALIGKYVYVGPVYSPKLFKINPSVDTLIIGASHSATAFDTNYFENTLNVASSGEPLFFTYYKAKALLKNNPHIKNLIVAISPIHAGKYSEKQLFKGNAGSREFMMKYYFLIDDLSDPLIDQLSSDNILGYLKFHWGLPFNYMSDLKVVFNYYTNQVKYEDYLFFGGVERVSGNHIEYERQEKKARYYFNDESGRVKPSATGLEVIRRIASLTEQFDVNLTIVTTPMHPYFIKQIPDNIKAAFDDTIADIQKLYGDLRVRNYSELDLEDKYYLDGDHLNTDGAVIFSQYLATEQL